MVTACSGARLPVWGRTNSNLIPLMADRGLLPGKSIWLHVHDAGLAPTSCLSIVAAAFMTHRFESKPGALQRV